MYDPNKAANKLKKYKKAKQISNDEMQRILKTHCIYCHVAFEDKDEIFSKFKKRRSPFKYYYHVECHEKEIKEKHRRENSNSNNIRQANRDWLLDEI